VSKTKDKLSSAERWLTDLVKRVNEQIAEIMNRFHCWYVRTVYGPVTEYRVTIDPLGKAGVTSTLRANGVKSWPLHTHRGVFTIAVKTEDAEEVIVHSPLENSGNTYPTGCGIGGAAFP